MHNYNILNRYVSNSKMGNWYEQLSLKQHFFKDYLKNKEQGTLLTTSKQQRIAYCTQPVELSKSKDGLLHYGQTIMLANKTTGGLLSFNLYEKIINDDAYCVTTGGAAGPSLRNVFTVEHPNDPTNTSVVKFGDTFRLYISNGNSKVTERQIQLYLQSWPMNPQRSSKISRNQEVSVTQQKSSYVLWTFQNLYPKLRYAQHGQQIRGGQEVLLKHVSTAQWLASDLNDYLNEFGDEWEVYAKSLTFNNKTQNLQAQKVGHISVEVPLRDQKDQNCWRIIASSD